MVKKTYFNAVSFTQGVINKIKAGEKVNIKKAKRVVESMVDQILEEEQLLLGMTAIKDYDEYTYHHSVNVSILSVALGSVSDWAAECSPNSAWLHFSRYRENGDTFRSSE